MQKKCNKEEMKKCTKEMKSTFCREQLKETPTAKINVCLLVWGYLVVVVFCLLFFYSLFGVPSRKLPEYGVPPVVQLTLAVWRVKNRIGFEYG